MWDAHVWIVVGVFIAIAYRTIVSAVMFLRGSRRWS